MGTKSLVRRWARIMKQREIIHPLVNLKPNCVVRLSCSVGSSRGQTAGGSGTEPDCNLAEWGLWIDVDHSETSILHNRWLATKTTCSVKDWCQETETKKRKICAVTKIKCLTLKLSENIRRYTRGLGKRRLFPQDWNCTLTGQSSWEPARFQDYQPVSPGYSGFSHENDRLNFQVGIILISQQNIRDLNS